MNRTTAANSNDVKGSWDRYADGRESVSRFYRFGTLRCRMGSSSSALPAPIGFRVPTLLHIWDLTTGELATTIEIADGITNDIAFSADGSRIFSARGDGTVRSWDAQTGELVWQIRAHLGSASAVRPSPDGRYIATSSADNNIRLSNPETGELLLTLQGHTNWPTEATFSPDGTRLATAGRDGTVRFWVVPVDELAELARSRLTRELTEEECQTFLHMEACP